ncbi:MAG: hypothetical protein U0800_10750 [Isosphaeraceae bacterium]
MRWRTRGNRAGMALALSMAMAGPALADAIDSASIADLGNFQATGISRDGRVAGMSGWKPAIYQSGRPLTMLDPTNGTGYAVISPGGTIAYSGGRPQVYSGSGSTAQVLRNGVVSDAGTASDGHLVGGGEYSIPHAVNDAGAVAGESHAFGRWNRAFTSSPDAWSGKYSPVAMGANGGSVSNALGINSKGTVVGWSDVATQWKNHAFVGTPSHDIGTLGGPNSQANAINDQGQVVGQADLSAGNHHAFLYDSGGMHDLGTLAGAFDSTALAINSLGQVVGNSGGHAVLFQDGEVIDLNAFLPKDSGWILQTAIGINDVGQIVGTGTLDGQDHSYLLSLYGTIVPAPEPSTWAIFAVAAIGLVGSRMRRK